LVGLRPGAPQRGHREDFALQPHVLSVHERAVHIEENRGGLHLARVTMGHPDPNSPVGP
jgi:hypothetical protein